LALPGVTVSVKGTKNNALTDFDGKYTIKAKQGDVLEFSFVGLKTKSVTVGASNTINLSMESDVTQLGEVVVLGYSSE